MASYENITQEASPYSVPSGRRVLSYSFVGGTGGGTLTTTNSAGGVSDPTVIAEGEAYDRNFPVEGRPVLGGGTSFAWTNIARYAVEIL